jgi:hypothetical protein
MIKDRSIFNPLGESDIETVEFNKRPESQERTKLASELLSERSREGAYYSEHGYDFDNVNQVQEHRVGYRTYFAAIILFFGGLVSGLSVDVGFLTLS